MNVLEGVVTLSKGVALLVVVIFMCFIVRQLPERIQRFLSAFAATLLLYAIFRELHGEPLSVLKSLLPVELLINFTVMLYAVGFAVRFARAFAAEKLFAKQKEVPVICLSGKSKHYFGTSDAKYFSYYFNRSPVILQ